MAEKSNFLLLLLDTARTANLSFYGYEKDTTPFLSNMVQSGEFMKIDRCYSQSIWSLPVYGSLFTGKLPNEHGAVDWESSIDENTLVNKLSEQGYYSEAISTHLISGGFGIGKAFDEVDFIGDNGFSDPVFDEFSQKSSRGEYDSQIQKYKGFLNILARNPNPESLLNSVKFLTGKLNSREDKGAGDVVEEIKNFDFSKTPFFLFANFVEPHFPHELPESFLENKSLDKEDLDQINEVDKRKATVGKLNIDDKTREKMLKAHDLELEYLDSKIEDIIQYLKDEDTYENTSILVLADHGDVFGEKGVWEHMGAITEGLIHVPLLIKPAEGLNLNKSEYPVSLMDLYSLILNFAQGKDYSFERKSVFTEYYGLSSQSDINPAEDFNADPDYWNRYQAAVTDWPYRLNADSLGNHRLVDIEKGEEVNDQDKKSQLIDKITDEIGELKKIDKRSSSVELVKDIDI